MSMNLMKHDFTLFFKNQIIKWDLLQASFHMLLSHSSNTPSFNAWSDTTCHFHFSNRISDSVLTATMSSSNLCLASVADVVVLRRLLKWWALARALFTNVTVFWKDSHYFGEYNAITDRTDEQSSKNKIQVVINCSFPLKCLYD